MKIYSHLIALLAVVTLFGPSYATAQTVASTTTVTSTPLPAVSSSTSTTTSAPATASAPAAAPAPTVANSTTASGVTVTTLTAPSAVSAAETKPGNVVIVNPAPAAPAPAAPAVAPTVESAPTEVSAAATPSNMQAQPTTVIEASPLTESNADQLRQMEQQTEVQTEQKIVERLEQARIADEQRRQKQILTSISGVSGVQQNNQQPAQNQDQKPAAAPAPAVIVVTPPAAPEQAKPAPQAAAPAADVPTKADVDAMVKADISEMNKPAAQPSPYFFSGTVGQINYHQTNVASFGALTLSLGKKFPSSWVVSGDLGYSNNNVSQDTFVYQKMDQYMLGLTARYVFFDGKIQPSLGGAVDYVRRQYSGLQNAYGTYQSGFGSSLDQTNSDAVDGGVVAAVDLAVSDNFSLGLEYRYMMNLGYKYEGQDVMNTAAYRQYLTDNGFGSGYTPLESTNYDLTSFVVRYTF